MTAVPVRFRREDPRLLTGRGRFAANIQLPRLAHMKVVRSTHAHARMRSVDTGRAQRTAGVLAVWTGDVTAWTMPVSATLPLSVAPRDPLARGVVGAVGDPIAVVVARDRYTAVDAAEQVAVDYEPLPAVLDIEDAQRPDAPLVHSELQTNVAYVIPSGPRVKFGSIDVVVRQRTVHQRLLPSPMETRSLVADWSAFDERLTLHLSTQAPHLVRTQLADILGLSEARVRVVAGDVGGAFGSKFNIFPEEVLAALLSRQLGVPVAWVEDRSESSVSSPHGRAMIGDVELLELAAHVLEAEPADLEWNGRNVEVRGTPTHRIDLYDLTRLAHQGRTATGHGTGARGFGVVRPRHLHVPVRRSRVRSRG